MFIFTDKINNKILLSGNEVNYMENGYPRMVDKNVAFPDDVVNIYEVDEKPDDVIEGKYCYTPETGFFPNPLWEEPNNTHGISNELYNLIRDEAVAQIEREVAGNANTETA